MKRGVVGLIGVALLMGLVAAAPGGRASGLPGAPGAPSAAPQATQDFQDVPVGSPFFTYIHNLYVDGVVGGYTCGGPGEPCVPPDNLPYFHPGANVTRGQNAKFTDNGRRLVTGFYTATATAPGLFTAVNADMSNSGNAAIYGRGATGVWGVAQSTGTSAGFGGYFANVGGGTGAQYGAYGVALTGVGLTGVSDGSTTQQGSVGVVGRSNASVGYGGVFTGTTGVLGASSGSSYSDGVIGFIPNTNCSPYCNGVYARETGDNGFALYASVANTGHPNDYGARITNYNLGNTALGLQVVGSALATGGYSTGGSYQMVVRYDGATALHAGDVLALDGANVDLDGATIFGTVPADGSNAAVGVAQYRYQVYDMPARPADAYHAAEPAYHNLQVDEQATAFQPGDYIQVVVLGQARMKPSGPIGVGDRLAVNADGTISATKDAIASIGRVAGTPDKDGYVLVFVNFK